MYLINSFFPIIFFLAIYYSGRNLDKIFFFNYKKNLIFYYTLIFLIIAIFLNILFFFNIDKKIIVKVIFYFFLFLLILNLTNLISDLKIFFKLSKQNINKSFFILLIALFLVYIALIVLPTTDPDSLDYHLGAPSKWLIADSFLPYYYWLNYRLVGFGEFLIYFGLVLNIENFGSSIQLLYILLFYFFLKENKVFSKSAIDQNLIYLSLFSMPIILSLLMTQKFFLAPTLIISSIIINIYLNYKSFNKLELFLIISSLYFCLLTKLNFLFYFILINMYFLKYINNKYFNKFIIYNIILLLIVSPFYYRNFIFYGDPISPFLEFIKKNPESSLVNFSNYVRSYESNLDNIFSFFLSILKTFIPIGYNSLTTFVGIFLFYFFMPKSEKKEKIYFYIGILTFILQLLIGQFSSRYLLISIIFLSIYFMINIKKNKFFTIIIICQTLLVIIFSSYPVLYFIFDNKNYLKNFAYEYDETKWLNNNIKNEKYISDIRSVYYLNDNHIIFFNYFANSSQSNEMQNNKLKEFIIENKILYASFKTFNESKYMSSYEYINKCFDVIDKQSFTIQTRKPIFLRQLDSNNLNRFILKRKIKNVEC
jgi:hypothetical protein